MINHCIPYLWITPQIFFLFSKDDLFDSVSFSSRIYVICPSSTVSAAEKNDAATTTLLHRRDGIIQVAGILLVPDTVLGNQAKELNFLSCQTRQSFSSYAQSPVCHLARYERAFVGVLLKSGFILVFYLPTKL